MFNNLVPYKLVLYIIYTKSCRSVLNLLDTIIMTFNRMFCAHGHTMQGSIVITASVNYSCYLHLSQPAAFTGHNARQMLKWLPSICPAGILKTTLGRCVLLVWQHKAAFCY